MVSASLSMQVFSLGGREPSWSSSYLRACVFPCTQSRRSKPELPLLPSISRTGKKEIQTGNRQNWAHSL